MLDYNIISIIFIQLNTQSNLRWELFYNRKHETKIMQEPVAITQFEVPLAPSNKFSPAKHVLSEGKDYLNQAYIVSSPTGLEFS